MAAQALGPVSGVADMGCGWMTLERHLVPGTRYVPVDLVARDARTVICDFAVAPPPATGVPAAACLGLLGYLRDPGGFLRALGEGYERAVVSYKIADATVRLADRQAIGYFHDFSSGDMERLFRATGWSVERRLPDPDPVQAMWVLVRPTP